MKLGIDVEKFLKEWAVNNSENFVEEIQELLGNEQISMDEKVLRTYTKTLNFLFEAISYTIAENNKIIEKQLRQAGVQLP